MVFTREKNDTSNQNRERCFFTCEKNDTFNQKRNLVPRVFSLSNMAATGEKTLAHSRNHVTDLSTESGNLFKMAAEIKSERIWVRGLETGENTGRPESQQHTGSQIIRICMEIYLKIDKTVKMYKNSY